MDSPACAIYSVINASVRMDAEERLVDMAVSQVSGQISKEQKKSADKIREQLKRQASDILEANNGGNATIEDIKQIFS